MLIDASARGFVLSYIRFELLVQLTLPMFVKILLTTSSGQFAFMRANIRRAFLRSMVHTSNAGPVLDLHCNRFRFVRTAIPAPFRCASHKIDNSRHDTSLDTAGLSVDALGNLGWYRRFRSTCG